uniref:Uncharacterized protein n=1 Tax=Anguilla anguilla TaxID=7936 RepID=A0A0E9RG86_ANGAN
MSGFCPCSSEGLQNCPSGFAASPSALQLLKQLPLHVEEYVPAPLPCPSARQTPACVTRPDRCRSARTASSCRRRR